MDSACVEMVEDWSNIQTNLYQYLECGKLGQIQTRNYRENKDYTRNKLGWSLKLRIMPEKQVVLVDEHCPTCKIALNKNGFNQKIAYIGEKRTKCTYFLQRYLCPICGEIQIDYTKFFADKSKYPPDIPKKARIYFSLGIASTTIQKVLLGGDLIFVPQSTINHWINSMSDDIISTLYSPYTPCSGHIQYDEIHLRLEGEKAYLLSSVDSRFHLVVYSNFSPNLTGDDVKQHFDHILKYQKQKIISLVHDGLPIYNSLLSHRSYRSVKEGTCRMHLKKRIKKIVYKAAGLSLRKAKENPLPEGYARFLDCAYRILDSGTYFDIIWQFQEAVSRITSLKNFELDDVLKIIKLNYPLLLNAISTPYLAISTSLVESLHHEIEMYPHFKKGQKTPEHIELIANSRILHHNLKALHRVDKELEKDRKYWDMQHNEYGFTSGIRGEKISLGRLKQKIIMYKSNLRKFWDTYFPEGTYNLFESLYALHP